MHVPGTLSTIKKMKSEQAISTKEFQDFLRSCRNYCELLENRQSSKGLLKLQKFLLELYSNGLNLQTIELESNKDFGEKLDDKEFDKIKKWTSEMLGENQCYWTIFDPTENVFGNESPVMGDLLDDVMDIYKDIKYQLMIFDLKTEESMENAVLAMKFDFWHHWSNHAIDAIRTIHYVIEKTEKYK